MEFRLNQVENLHFGYALWNLKVEQSALLHNIVGQGPCNGMQKSR